MTLILDNITLPERGRVEVNLSFEIKVTAEEARKKVRRWLHDNVTMFVDADDTPTLVMGEKPKWRVIASFTFPAAGRLGDVGTAYVDAESGEMLTDPETLKAEIERRLESEIKPKMPKDTRHVPRELPPDYIAKLNPPPSLLVKKDK
ncbi:MAG: hypothetical protein HZB52_13665 [Chloroflexi bacterium]|nr:hypothetical protein [Chloroflexota bacterium]